MNTARLLGRNTASAGAIEEITLGTGLSFSGTTLNAAAGIGGSTGATDNAVLRADGTGGATLQSSGVTIDDSDFITAPRFQVNASNYINLPATNQIGFNAGSALVARFINQSPFFGLYLDTGFGIYYPSGRVLLQSTDTVAVQLSATQTTVPTCSTNCGTSPSVVGTDTFMRVTMGTSGSPASGWVVTFNGTWAAAPVCTVQMAKTGMAVGKQALTVVTTTTTITVVTNGTAPATTDVYAITCGGVQ